MSNPNQSYFDKYFDPVVKDIDKVNIYEFENGMDFELTKSGKAINVDSIKEAQNKVLKNLKKDPAYYTNMLAAESVKMFGEYGSGKGRAVKSNTAKEAEAIKKDGKFPKNTKQDSPFGIKNELKGKYKSSGMEPVKKVPGSLNENLNSEQESKLRALANDWKKGTDKQKQGAEALLRLLDREVEFSKDKENLKKEYNESTEEEQTRKAIKDTFKFQVTGGKEGKPMSQDKKLPPNTKMKKENVNVGDSRKIRLTPTTKNQIFTLVHETIEEALFQNKLNPSQVISVKPGEAITKDSEFSSKFTKLP